MEDLERQLDLIAECIPPSLFKAKVEEIAAAVKQELADTRAELERVEETAIANVRAEVADSGASCHWCLDQTTLAERRRIISLIGDVCSTMSFYFTGEEAKAVFEVKKVIIDAINGKPLPQTSPVSSK